MKDKSHENNAFQSVVNVKSQNRSLVDCKKVFSDNQNVVS